MRALLSTIAVTLTLRAAEAFAQDKPPLLETITIVSDCHNPPFTTTVAEEVARLDGVADAIALVEVRTVSPIPATRVGCEPKWTRVSGVIAQFVKSATTPLGNDTRGIEFDFEGVPILQPGSRYLVFFNLAPGKTQWYPLMPFLIDASGRLQQAAFENDPLGWKSPINGLPLSEIIKMLRPK